MARRLLAGLRGYERFEVSCSGVMIPGKGTLFGGDDPESGLSERRNQKQVSALAGARLETGEDETETEERNLVLRFVHRSVLCSGTSNGLTVRIQAIRQ